MTVLGAGGWGTALALAAVRAGSRPTLWARRPDFAAELGRERENRAYLSGVELGPEVEVTSDLTQAVGGADFALVTVPSIGVPALLPELPGDLGLVLCAKGLAPDGERLSEWARARGPWPLAVLSGPNHAEEIGRGLPAATVVASRDADFARRVQAALMSASLRVYTSRDVVGVELGGVLKNVLALAAGMADGLDLGDNAKASLLTRGLQEMARYLRALGAEDETVYGLSGLGDLIATATSRHSRNRAAGEAIARGHFQAGETLVEGLRTAALLETWASAHGHDLPIVRAVNRVAAGEWTPRQGVQELMERAARDERPQDSPS